MKITIDIKEKAVRVDREDGSRSDYSTADPAEILLIIAQELVPHPQANLEHGKTRPL